MPLFDPIFLTRDRGEHGEANLRLSYYRLGASLRAFNSMEFPMKSYSVC